MFEKGSFLAVRSPKEFDNVQEEEEAADEIGDDPNSASECETDISDSESVTHLSKKRCGRKEVPEKPMNKTVKVQPWSLKEKEVTLKFFRRHIKKATVPNMADVELCKQETNNVLKNRSWRQIKYFVYNQIKKVKKLKVQCH